MPRPLRIALFVLLAGCGTNPHVPSRAVVRACETETACMISNDFLDCVTSNDELGPALSRNGTAYFGADELACLAQAGDDCDAAARCVNLGQAATSCGDPSTLTSHCDGDVVDICLDGTTRAFDCASVGLHCVTDVNGNGDCGLHACAPDYVACLDDTTLVTCNNGVETRQDCTVDARGCVTVGATGSCAGVGSACNPSVPFCAGDVLTSCDGDGHAIPLDCAKRGLRCIVHGNGVVDCANGDACDENATPTCDDATGELHYCFYGKPLVADCRGDGFSGCNATGCAP